MRYLFLALALVLAASGARAQVPGCVVGAQCVLLQGFAPTAVPASLAASPVSAAVALPVVGPTLGVLVTNAGPAGANVVLGASTAVATAFTGSYVAPGASVYLPQGTATTLAAITAAGPAALSVQSGTGAPLVVSGAVAIATPPPLAYAAPDSASVATTSGVLAAAGAYARALTVCTLPASTTNVWLNVRGGAAVVGAGVRVPKAGGCAPTFGVEVPMPAAAIDAITDDGSSQTVSLFGG